MLVIVVIQSALSLMTINPSLNKQFNVLVNLAVVTNIIPYIPFYYGGNDYFTKSRQSGTS